jgi:hypothetical protein
MWIVELFHSLSSYSAALWPLFILYSKSFGIRERVWYSPTNNQLFFFFKKNLQINHKIIMKIDWRKITENNGLIVTITRTRVKSNIIKKKSDNKQRKPVNIFTAMRRTEFSMN